MMSKAEKVIQQKVPLRWKYLKNNADSSFQNIAEKLYGCHLNIHEGQSVELNFSAVSCKDSILAKIRSCFGQSWIPFWPKMRSMLAH